MRITLLVAFLAFFLAGCATRQDSPGTEAGLQKRMVELTKKPDAQKAVVVVVPAANNALSNAMMLAALKGGSESNAVKNISSMLQAQKTPAIAVTGEDDAIAAETLVQAMKKQEGKTTSTKVFFIGAPSYAPDLKAQADKSSIRFEVIPYPEKNK